VYSRINVDLFYISTIPYLIRLDLLFANAFALYPFINLFKPVDLNAGNAYSINDTAKILIAPTR
jgi:hypothetical protein